MQRTKLAIPAAAIVLLSSSLGYGRLANPAHARVASADYSGTVAITDWQFPDSLGLGGAYSAGVANVEVSGAMIDSPLGFDQKGNFYADLATEVPSTSNGGIKTVGGNEVVTVHLKPNQKWSDGSPVTNADYIATMMFDFSPEYNATSGVDRINTITFSGNDMVITYKGLFAPALSNIIGPEPLEYFQKKYGIKADAGLFASYDANRVAAYYKGASYKGSNWQKLVNKWVGDSYNTPSDIFNGPYKLAEWTPDQRITLVPNTFYNALPADPKHPRPAKIQFVVVSENANTLVQSLSASSTYNSIDKAEDFQLTDVVALRRSKYQVIVPDALFYEHLELNLGSGPLKDVRVRQALLYGIDKMRYLQALFPGLDAATYTKIALSSPFPSTSPWSNNSSLPKSFYNPARSRALLAAAGYGPGGKKLHLLFVTTPASARIRSSQLLQRLWAQIGVDVRIKYATAFGQNGLFEKYADGGLLYHRRFDIAEFAFSTPPDPDSQVNISEPQYIPDATHPTGQNYIGLNDARVTNDLEQARTTLDEAKRHQFYNDFQTYFVNQAYWISLYNRPNIIAFKGTIGNFKPNVTSAGDEWNAFEWWVDPSGSQKAAAS